MLPGFRILFAATVLSFSVLIFGLGAAALLRSAHEDFVGVPSWRATQQLMPTVDSSRPSLAMLRVEPERVATAKFAPAKSVAAKSEAAKSEAAKPVEAKPVEAKSVEAKSVEAKSVEAKSVEAKSSEAKSDSAKIASVDKPAIEKEIAAEKSADEDTAKPVAKPRARRAKRTRSAKTIRHWRAKNTLQQQQTTNSPFAGFGTPDQTALSVTGSNRRTAARTPF